MSTPIPMKKQFGLSLVEVMVALVISLFLLGGIVQVYLGNRASYGFSDANSRIIENGRFSLDTITTDTRMAGFWGCTKLQGDTNGDGTNADDNPFIQNHLDNASGDYSILRHDFIEMPSITATVNNGLNDSDSLTLRGAKPGQSVFTADFVTPGDTSITVTENRNLADGDIILITNCYTAKIFEATSVAQDTAAGVTTISHLAATPNTGTPGNTNRNDCDGSPSHCLLAPKDLPFTPNNAAAFSLQTVTYTIAVSGTGSGEPALWRSVNNVNEELIEGVEQMQVLFGEDTDGDGFPNQYLESNDVADMQQITAIRLWLVVRSERDNVLETSQTYSINGVNTTAADRRLRQVFSTTIDLRNK